MLYRKIESYIEEHLKSDSDKILLLEGARQIGKSYIIREVAKRLYVNFVELNFVEDDEGAKLFKEVHIKMDIHNNDSIVLLKLLHSIRISSFIGFIVFDFMPEPCLKKFRKLQSSKSSKS